MTFLAHANRILPAQSEQRRAQLRVDPRRTLTVLGIRVVDVPALARDEPDSGERWCDGLSLHEANTILVAPTTQSRRESFTVLHEYAHILVDNDNDALDWLADRPDPDHDREALCDEIAARILIPDSELDDVCGAGPIRAHHLQDLHRRNFHASQMACAVGLARRMPCAGAIVLTDRPTGQVVFVAARGDLDIRPRRNVEVPYNHPLRRITPDTPQTARSFWAEPWGEQRSFFLDATASERRTYAVLLVNDIGGITDFHHEEPEVVRAERPRQHLRCPCGGNREISSYPCDTCGHLFCPSCGRCDCQRRDALTARCAGCFTSVPARDITDGSAQCASERTVPATAARHMAQSGAAGDQ